ncbi:aromatic ring-hydroxylating dioxygenase subunit alpha [Ottowia sp.]|uniref:aromatic ring-hydroxylating oxygenase subunit alpha n=1 Tax=Ottowia sp. TaxID=1898956 RepID=UPI002C7E2279|nr:aromatic ring-hydroxylating dioxygenase subunit alpha [Ottowia sp.]HRN74409.1 aromatic ring-hydroxylating dioxygenase subunit alpha [Ottowia sp.]HRQ01231.1 aromatic ring-hydroxylating dioxygenase subunit alpha [Ottowia sp.]
MSDLSLQLQQAASQLPVQAYFDQALFERELQLLFKPGPRYVGHQLAVPNPGDYCALPQEANGRALVRNPQGGVELISNVCRHRQALMLDGRGSLQTEGKGHAGGNIVCPVHRWTYSSSGELLGAPHFKHDPCLHLANYKLREWNGLLFDDNGRDILADLQAMGPVAQDLSFEGFALDHVEMHECNYNWKTFIEVYLEDYHVGPFHPGLGNFVTCDDLQWQFGQEFSVQTVGVAPAFKPGTDVYRKWHEVLLNYQGGDKPTRGAIWLTYYPHIMVEWYPHVLTVSTLHPISVDRTMNVVEFYYPEDIVAFEREFVEAQRAAYMETAIEDDEIAERMDAGRKALMLRGVSEVGPYQSPMEDGMQHFHEWYRKKIGANPLNT